MSDVYQDEKVLQLRYVFVRGLSRRKSSKNAVCICQMSIKKKSNKVALCICEIAIKKKKC